ncbi:MAG: ribonuclease PH [Vampirovibrio sp.]|nr:ribonuclease PH [Vampirovibrio sp.]
MTFERPDRRRHDELRPIQVVRRYTRYAPGSVLISYGETKVLVNASVEERVPRHVQESHGDGAGWITAEYAMLPAATHSRTGRERMRVSPRSTEIQRLIGRSLRACVDLKTIGPRTITVDCDVIQADGGTRVTAITGGFIALMDAFQSLKEKELLAEIPPVTPVAAVSVGVKDGDVLLDLNYEEDFAVDVDANVVMNKDGHIIEFQATCEGLPFDRVTLDKMVDLSQQGIAELITIQEKALAEKAEAPVSAAIS